MELKYKNPININYNSHRTMIPFTDKYKSASTPTSFPLMKRNG